MPVRHIVVVFDGPSGDGDRRLSGAIEVRFAPSADAWIQQAIRTSRSPSRLLILSNDREILATAKSHGARTDSIEQLFARSTAAVPDRRGAPEKSSLPAADARRITDELAKRWIRS